MNGYSKHPMLNNDMLPVDIVLHSSWWYHNTGLTFDEDFFFHPKKRVEAERQMERTLYERWGQYGLGQDHATDRPHISAPIFLHSECSHTMISVKDYERYHLPYDIEWSRAHRPYGIHYCGSDPHRYAEAFAKIPHLDFLDVGWGGNIKQLRQHLPQTFLNIRLSPVDIVNQSPADIQETITTLVNDSGNPRLTGICCINMDQQVADDKITAIFETVEQLRQTYRS